MKQIAKNAVVASILLIFSLSSFAQVQTLAFSQYCAAGFSQTWTLTITGPYFVRMTYSADIDVSDNISFFNPEGGYPIAYNSGYCTGSVLTTSTPGSAKVGFYAATAGYKSFIVQYYANNPLETKGDLNVLGNAAVAGTTTLNGNTTVNGLFSVPSTSVTNSIMGKLGIGTASATRKLEIWDNSASRFSFSGSNCSSGYEVANTIDNTGYKINVGSSIRDFRISIAGTDRFTVAYGGNVGIGTTSPTQKLSIESGRIAIKAPGATVSDEGYNGALIITKPEASGQYINLVRQGQYPWSIGTVYNSSTFAIGYGKANDADFTSAFISIDPNGKVGVGTSTPKAKLHINSGADNNYAAILATSSQGNNLVVSSLNPTNGNTEVFKLEHEFFDDPANRKNGYISFFRGGDSGHGFLSFGSNGLERLRIDPNGKVGVGTTSPDELLTVNGIVHAKEVKIDLTGALADYVFDKSYDLMPLNKVEEYVNTNSHLPEMPSADEVKEKGMSMGEMQNKLLQKVEELTLYVIDLKKTNDAQNAEIKELKKQLSAKP